MKMWKMDEDIYLNFFYKVISNGYLVEKLNLIYSFQDKQLTKRDLIKKNITVEKAIVGFRLDDKKILLVEDFPLNFLLSYGILVGDKSELYEYMVQDKGNVETYISDKSVLEKIRRKKDVEESSVKKISYRDIYKKTFSANFVKPKIMNEIFDYIKDVKKLSMQQIHVINSKNIENFIPNVKKNHFNLAKSMSIPLIRLIEKNFIKNTTINIYDNSTLKKIIKPLFTYNVEEIQYVCKKNGMMVYRDVTRNYFIDIEEKKEEFIKKIQDAEKVNFNKEKVIANIQNSKPIRVSSSHGEMPLPIWKSTEENRYLEIEDKEDFRLISGLNVKLDANLFNEIYLQTTGGKGVVYKNKFLYEKMLPYLENISINYEGEIHFKDINDLIFKFIFHSESIDHHLILLKKEKINSDKINQFSSYIRKLLKLIIEKTIEFNRTPHFRKPHEIVEYFYLDIIKKLNDIYANYLIYPSKEILLTETLEIVVLFRKVLKENIVKLDELYYFKEIFFTLIKISKEFDDGIESKLEEDISNFFSEDKNTNKIKLHIEQEQKEESSFTYLDFYKDVVLINSISKDKDVKIYLKKDFDLLILKDIETISVLPDYKEYIIPNMKKLREIFKYSYKEISQKIKKYSKDNIQEGKIIIPLKDKKAVLKKDFYSIYKKYEGYREIAENDFFLALIKRKN